MTVTGKRPRLSFGSAATNKRPKTSSNTHTISKYFSKKPRDDDPNRTRSERTFVKVRVVDTVQLPLFQSALPTPPLTGNASPVCALSTTDDEKLDHSLHDSPRASVVEVVLGKPRKPDPDSDSDDRPVSKTRRSRARKSYVEELISSDDDSRIPKAARRRISCRFRDGDEDDVSDFGAASIDSSAASDEPSSSDEAGTDHDHDEDSDDVSDIVESPQRKGSRRVTVPYGKQNAKHKKTTAESNDIDAPAMKMSRSKQRMVNLTRGLKKGIDRDLPPMYRIADIFLDISQRSLGLGVKSAVRNLKGHPLRVATMCSGTESPLLAMGLIRDALQSLLNDETFDMVHLFSAEIEPFKQAYIERNFAVPIIFRDITELTGAKDTTHQATTAYGSKVEIPDNIDLLIAGTACVDFSGLNAHKKDLADKGESGDTFRAVLSYARLWRPRILILENVFNAPWDDMLGLYEKEDYATGGVLVDTKIFYLPQTRQRGYMVCLDRRTLKNATEKARKWEHVMEKLRRPASSPVTDFLLPNDDPTVIRARMLRARAGMMNDTIREVDWSKCAIRHIQYRRDKVIGNARPFTSWQESGTVSVPDYADREWHTKLVERIWDMQDCSILRKALPVEGNYDASFKTRIWDLSQGVDRFTDTTPFGISSCLTPTGIFFLTDRGGPITHQESLILQGLPIDRISFTTETGANIQDLAGNAMSSTVVGSAIVAALIAAFGSEGPSGSVEVEVQDTSAAIHGLSEKLPDVIAPPNPTVTEINTPSELRIEMDALKKDAAASASKCACEGPFDMAPKSIQTCVECGHTSCLACGNKPVHQYSSTHTPRRARMAPVDFVSKWAPQMPSQFKFLTDHNSLLEDLRKKARTTPQLAKDYFAALETCLNSTFSFQKFHRGRSWTITYDCSDAQLLLVVTGEKSEWQLFAKPSTSLPGNSPLRQFLEKPAAVMDNSDSEWKFRIPCNSKTSISIQGQGDRMSSWMARLNLPQFGGQQVWQELCVKPTDTCDLDVAGTYRHLPQCGTACESLYKRVDSSQNGDSMFMLIDPDSINDPSYDSVVFAADPERLQQGQKRRVLLRLDPEWRPWKEGKKFNNVGAFTDQAWVPAPASKISLCPLSVKLDLVAPAALGESVQNNCNRMDTLFSVRFSNNTLSASQDAHGIVQVISTSDKAFFLDHGWIFQPLDAHLTLRGWQTFHLSEHDLACERCVPSMPYIRWKLSQDGRSLRPYEDATSATSFEKCLKHRPDLFCITKQRKDGAENVTVSLNVASLVHRALGKLQRIDAGGATEQRVTWTVDPTYTESSAISLSTFSLMSNDRDKSFDEPLDLLVDLWPKQRQSLAWMLSQESDQGRLHTIEEAAEAMLPHLNWRAEARASKCVSVRGGIQASHPGFGKTICTLALVQTDFQNRDMDSVVREMKDTPEDQGRVNVAASLVLAPKHLVKQWRDEVDKVLGKSYAGRTIMIQSAHDLSRYKVAQFRQARIIIANQEILTSDAYIKKVALFAAIPEPAATKGREYKTWLDFATTEIKKHLEILEQKGARALAKVIEGKFKAHLDDETFQAVVPSKRLKGRAYAEREWGETGGKGSKVKSSSVKVEASSIDSCLFEMFNFNRIVVDEFTYLNTKDYASVTALKADKRWILSATARLQDPCDIARMASLIGVKLRVGENASGALSTRNLRTIRSEMTDFELFQTFRDAPSSAITERTYELAQIFLDNFVRQNILEFIDFPYEDHIVPVTIGLSHRIVYTELSQHLNSQDMRIKKGRKGLVEERDREYRLYENLKDVESAEEALSRLAAIFDGAGKDKSGDVAALLKKRQHEHQNAERRLAEAIAEGQRMSVACKGKEVAFEAWKGSIVQDQSFGCADTTARVEELIREAEKKHGVVKTSASMVKQGGSDDDGPRPALRKESKNSESMKEHVSTTNKLAKQYLATGRSIRFVKNAQRLQENDRQCESQGCQTAQPDLAVSALCGHSICGTCLETLKTNSGLCMAEGCRAPVQDYHLLRAGKLPAHVGMDNKTQHDAKVIAVMDLLSKIQSKKEQAILFVRYESQIDDMERACKKHQPRPIRCTAVRDNGSAAQLVTNFQKEKNEATRNTVIILNASNASAAGVNLTNANHVLFLSPLLTDTQYDYEAAMAQAVGRVRRPGQSRDIHVYRFVSLDTIDVDILEHRERRETPLSEQGAAPAKAVSAAKSASSEKMVGDEARERCQLIRGADSVFRLMPKSWLVGDGELGSGIEGRTRVRGYEDFSSLVKFSKAYSED